MTKRVDIDELDPTDSLGYMVGGKPFTGEIVEFAPTGEPVELITVRNGLPHGSVAVLVPQRAAPDGAVGGTESPRRTVAEWAPQRRPRRRVDLRRLWEPVVEGRLERARRRASANDLRPPAGRETSTVRVADVLGTDFEGNRSDDWTELVLDGLSDPRRAERIPALIENLDSVISEVRSPEIVRSVTAVVQQGLAGSGKPTDRVGTLRPSLSTWPPGSRCRRAPSPWI